MTQHDWDTLKRSFKLLVAERTKDRSFHREFFQTQHNLAVLAGDAHAYITIDKGLDLLLEMAVDKIVAEFDESYDRTFNHGVDAT